MRFPNVTSHTDVTVVDDATQYIGQGANNGVIGVRVYLPLFSPAVPLDHGTVVGYASPRIAAVLWDDPNGLFTLEDTDDLHVWKDR